MPFYSIQDNTFPFLTLTNHIKPTSWDYGTFYQMQLFSRFVRISKYNVQYWALIQSAKTLDLPSAWRQQTCVPYTQAMCRVVDDADMMLFPSNVVDMPSDSSRLLLPKSFQSDTFNMSCINPHSNRQLVTDDVRYEVSLCDLVDGNFEFVYDVDDAILFWRKNEYTDGQLIFTTLLSLYLFTKLCEQFLLLLTNTQKRQKFEHSTCTLPFFIACYYAFLQVNRQTYLMTQEEMFMQILIIAYVLCFNIVNLSMYYKNYQLSNVSYVSIASNTLCLFLLTSHMHNTYDTPFQQILTFIFGTRMMLKIFNFIQIHVKMNDLSKFEQLMKLMHILIDMFVFLCLHVKIGPVVAKTDMDLTVATFDMIFLSLLCGCFLHSVQFKSQV